MARLKRKSGRLQVFKGREARLNRAIFRVLALKGPLAIWDILKEVKAQRGLRHVRYPSVLKRVRSLQEPGYVERLGVRKTKAGGETSLYRLTAKAELAVLFDSVNLDKFFTKLDEATASKILAAIKKAQIFHDSEK